MLADAGPDAWEECCTLRGLTQLASLAWLTMHWRSVCKMSQCQSVCTGVSRCRGIYMKASREVKRFDNTTRSPVYAYVSATLKARAWRRSWRWLCLGPAPHHNWCAGDGGRHALGQTSSRGMPTAVKPLTLNQGPRARAGPADHPRLWRPGALPPPVHGRAGRQRRLVVCVPVHRALGRLPPGHDRLGHPHRRLHPGHGPLLQGARRRR